MYKQRYLLPAVFHSLSLVSNVKHRVGGAKLLKCAYLVMDGFLRKQHEQRGILATIIHFHGSWNDQMLDRQCALQLHCSKHTEKWFETHCASG